MSETTPRPAFRTRLRLALAIVGVLALVAAIALYATRRMIAREALTGWLRSKGVASEAEVQAFGLRGFTGRLRIGDPRNPDFTAERAEVVYRLRGLSPEVQSVVLYRPVLRARLQNGNLSVGALDPLIEEFRRRPPKPDAAKPRIEIRGGLLLLATDYGPVRITADARVEDEKLMALAATGAPARLTGPGWRADLSASRLNLRTRGDRLHADLSADLRQATAAGAAVQGGALKLTADLPYPDFKRRRGEGALALTGALSGRRLTVGGQNLGEAQLSANFRGRSAGWIPDLVVTGAGGADLRAASGAFAGATSAALRGTATFEDVRWTRRGGDAVSARLSAEGRLQDLRLEDLSVADVAGRAFGRASIGPKGADLDLALSARGLGGWTGLGAPTPEDSADIAAVKRAVRAFRFEAPGLRLTEGGVAIAQAVRLTPQTGGLVTLAPAGSGWRLTTQGGRLPEVTADVASFRFAEGGARARGRVRARLDIGPIVGGVYDAGGQLQIQNGITRFTADRCAGFSASRLELGENDVTDLSGRLCPAGAPLLTLGGGDWRLHGRAQAASADAGFLQAKVRRAAGLIDMGQRGKTLDARLQVTAAQVLDAAPETRFHPLAMTGDVRLARDLWTGRLVFRDDARRQIATADLRHDGRTEAGEVRIETGDLVFAPEGLQPAPLSPMAEMLGSPVAGQARFVGGFSWTKDGEASGGTLTIPRLDFTSPAGKVVGLSGQVAFTSLAPLVAAPGQVLKAESLAAIVPLTGVEATFGIEGEALQVSGGEAAVGGGRVRLEQLVVPFAPGAPMTGVLNVEGVQLHDLVEASPFGDRVDLDARVSGRIPFEVVGGQVRVREGALKAIQPGRISIQREAITGVAASGAVAAPVPAAEAAVAPGSDTFTDFAYQAMENLAFDQLDATINSLPEGRVGVLFRIVGRHDPPGRQEIRLGLFELLSRKFMNRKLPLPSGTGVNLTLDTTLNLDQLLADYAEYQRLRSSAPVQP